MEIIGIYLVAGVVAGLVSGLFGLGGGLTIVPALAFALPLEGVGEKYVMHLAVGTSLVVMVVTALYTTVLRHRHGDLDWALFRRIAPRVVIGAVLGAICGDLLPGLALRVFFIGFVSYTIARALHRRYGAALRSADSEEIHVPATMPRGASLWIYGLATGVCGALLGAGAAIIIVPYLRAARYRIQLASAIAAGLSAVIGVGAGVGYVVGGLNETDLPSAAIGYLYLPAFAGLSTGALIGSPLGVKISHSLDEDIQFWLFLAYLATVLGVMVLR
ncbi:MAG: sulfite exporter TauE/SafE family protein [Deltaproteobacteria bacterium]|nr:sulfite exporter TauE/SafE family protein [Deltaproteobacteria bacterium]